MKRKQSIFLTLFMITIVNLNAQVGIGTTSPAASAAFDVTSTTKGVLIPRMTSDQRTAITSPAEGLMVFQTNAPAGLWMFVNGVWIRYEPASGVNSFSGSTAFAANTAGSALVIALGTADIPFPSAQNLGSVTVNAANTIFTVPTAGRYRISYRINATATVGVGAASQVLIDGSAVAALRFAPLLNVSSFQAEGIVNLNAGSTVRVQLTGLLGVTTLLSASQGAALIIQKVGD